MAKFDVWWSSLTISQKERIASKANKKPVHYPECTAWWNSIDEEQKTRIHDHCVDSHGYFLKDWEEGTPLT